jgi:hypothetical protein
MSRGRQRRRAHARAREGGEGGAMAIRAVSHVAIGVRDMERSLRSPLR